MTMHVSAVDPFASNPAFEQSISLPILHRAPQKKHITAGHFLSDDCRHSQAQHAPHSSAQQLEKGS